MFGLSDYYKSRKKSTKKQKYMVNTGRSKMLDSFYFENQVWGALQSLESYIIAKNKDEYDKMEHYARIIQECQHDLGLEVSSFDNIGMPASSFLWQIAQEDDDNNQGHEVSDEEYQSERYEQERFTDIYIPKILEMIIMKRIGLVRSHHTSQLSDVFVS
ncbi:MAG: hypothetical protein ACJ71F_05860 [Nitrososphaeraceae archaeon]